jgi:hypothetical protein
MNFSFDGPEAAFDTLQVDCMCPRCRGLFSYQPALLRTTKQPLLGLDEAALKHLKIKRDTRTDGVITFTRSRQRVQCLELSCVKCFEVFHQLVTIQEVQPTRYIFRDYGALEALRAVHPIGSQ